MKLNNKWLNGAIPALLIHCSIGTVYCWSLLKDAIAAQLGSSVASIEWAFSLAIFFLGMSAAFGGNLVEKNVKRSAFLSTICFTVGMIGTGFAILMASPVAVLLSYGVVMGIGLGIGYLTPVKTLMMWFSEHKGLATGIAITGFGLAKVIASPIIQYLLSVTSIYNLFFILGG
ncbi:MAG: MFS transporter [Bacteroidales bacterium]|nr:MFS transporter [Bacteroidales bacterium]